MDYKRCAAAIGVCVALGACGTTAPEGVGASDFREGDFAKMWYEREEVQRVESGKGLEDIK